MGFDQYHEPPQELSEDTRTFVRVIQSMIEETEAIDWYVQRLAIDLLHKCAIIGTCDTKRSKS